MMMLQIAGIINGNDNVVLCWVWLVLCVVYVVNVDFSGDKTLERTREHDTIWSHSSQLDAISISVH